MKKVDVIRPGSLKQIIGPAGTLKRIIKHKPYFINRGYDIDIFTYDSLINGEANVVPELKKETQHKTSVLTKIKSYVRANLYRSKLLSLMFMKRGDKAIFKLVDFYLALNRQPDYVIFHSVNECYYFLKKNPNKNIKTACFFHSDGIPLKMEEIYFPKLKGSKYFKEILDREKFVVENVNKCVFIAEHGRKNFLNLYKDLDESKAELILNGIEDFTELEKKYIESIEGNTQKAKYSFCCVGTINTRKGQGIIIEALKKVDKKVLPLLHFTFVGDGAERGNLENKVKELNLSENVSFVGAVDNKEVFKYLLEANIYILMSLNEGLPISIIEAMRSKLPVISTRIAGIPELVNETNGIVIEPDANQLLDILNNIESYDWKFLGENSRKRFEKEFTFERMKKQYCDMLDII